MCENQLTVADIGEIRLLKEVLLPSVTQNADSLGDDCARLELGNRKTLWSMDPCPTPVAHLLGVGSPTVLGWYTALINLSDIAACGGTPKGLLVSLEMPGDTTVAFVEAYQKGLMEALSRYETPLLGGNVKSAQKFSATGTIIGVEGARTVSRHVDADDCDAFLIGACGAFWASVVGHQKGWGPLPVQSQNLLRKALMTPDPQIVAGKLLSSLAFQVASMDCSDGPANAIFQLATMNSMDLVVPDNPSWQIPDAAAALLAHHGVSIENACYHFGDWQLACLVPHEKRDAFLAAFAGMPVTWMGRAKKGLGGVVTTTGRKLLRESLNENFRQGYNSIASIEDLVNRYLIQPVFDCAGE